MLIPFELMRIIMPATVRESRGFFGIVQPRKRFVSVEFEVWRVEL